MNLRNVLMMMVKSSCTEVHGFCVDSNIVYRRREYEALTGDLSVYGLTLDIYLFVHCSSGKGC